MGTEKFIAFKEDGSAYRLKGRILRFLDNEPVSEADKTNIRSTLSVPASAEGLTPANNLSDLDNAATARTNLSVNSIDEDAEATGTKLVGPALYFDGVNDYLEVADDAKLSFTDGTDDLPFSISGWINMSDATNFTVASKYSSANEWRFYVNALDDLSLALTDGTNSVYVVTDTALTAREGEWVHVACTYNGAGPNSGNAFTAAANGIILYVNGVAVPVTATNNASYAGMVNTSDPVRLGRQSGVYTKGQIKDVKLYNRSLTADEVAQLARGVDLGYSDEYAGALGGLWTSDFSAGVDGTTAVNGVVAGNIDSISGQDDNLRFTANAGSSFKKIQKDNITTVGKRNRVTFDYFIPSGQSNIDGFAVSDGGVFISAAATRTLGAWTRFEAEYVGQYDDLHIWLTDGASTTYDDTGGDDVAYFRNIKITEIGTLADFRAEDYNQSANKLIDRSTNNFVGVGTGVTLTGKRRHLSAATLDLTNLPTSSAGLSAGEVYSNSGVLTIV